MASIDALSQACSLERSPESLTGAAQYEGWMPLSAHERQVMLLNLRVTMVPDHAPQWSVADFFNAIEQLHASGAAAANVADELSGEDEEGEVDGKILIRIADTRTAEDGSYTVLVHHGDAAAPDPNLINLRSGRVWAAGKGVDDALAHACHFVIAGSPSLPKAAPVRAALERAPVLGYQLSSLP